MLLLSHAGLAQHDLRVKLSVKSQPRLDTLLSQISRQTGFFFSYNEGEFSGNTRVGVQAGEYSLKALLDVIKNQTGYQYKLIENHIVLNKPKTVHTAHATKPASAKKESERSETDTPASLGVPTKNPVPGEAQKANAEVTPAPTRTVPDSLEVEGIHDLRAPVIDSLQGQAPQSIGRSDTAGIPAPPNKIADPKNRERGKPSRAAPKLDVSVLASETLYSGIQLNAGMAYLYAIGSFRTNFTVSGFGYGLGSSFKLSEKSSMSLEVSTRSLSHWSTAVETRQDTAQSFIDHRVKTRSQVNQLVISYNLDFGRRFSLSLAPVFSVSQSEYWVDNEKSNLHWGNFTDDSQFTGINPPFVISDNFKSTASVNKKSWVGFQVSLICHLIIFRP